MGRTKGKKPAVVASSAAKPQVKPAVAASPKGRPAQPALAPSAASRPTAVATAKAKAPAPAPVAKFDPKVAAQERAAREAELKKRQEEDEKKRKEKEREQQVQKAMEKLKDLHAAELEQREMVRQQKREELKRKWADDLAKRAKESEDEVKKRLDSIHLTAPSSSNSNTITPIKASTTQPPRPASTTKTTTTTPAAKKPTLRREARLEEGSFVSLHPPESETEFERFVRDVWETAEHPSSGSASVVKLVQTNEKTIDGCPAGTFRFGTRNIQLKLKDDEIVAHRLGKLNSDVLFRDWIPKNEQVESVRLRGLSAAMLFIVP